MGTLFLSFTIAIAGAIGLVSLSKTFDLESYTTRIFPLIPILYAIIYNAIEQGKTGKAKPIPPSQAKEEMKTGAKVLFRNITTGRIITDVAVSFGIKFSLEIVLVALFLSVTGQGFSAVYGTFNMETVGRFLRGDHPWLEGPEGISLLALLSLITSYGTGLWIGYTSQGKAILEGVIAGAAVTFITAMTNMLILYRRIEEAANEMAKSLGYGIPIGFVSVLILQVLLYGLWSGISQRAKQERALRASIKKSVRKPKK
ncbi:MAG: hypothetical protein A2010_18710 [Nitrospirae bacterium GWD2_57_9]|nr:MAG: hypothetical protein A2010_18710 [Nitrospirae bacterium GWD2_57_9]OGW50548.1 MAG: hypothetical protein A2078_10910 [Nitrospirae bacterium GWC2_57_9]